MADGEVVTCANMYAASAGTLSASSSFQSIWNGEVMQSVRASLNTEQEWDQCRSCWYREIKYHSQRAQWAAGEHYPLTEATSFSEKAWDFRDRQET